MIYAVFSRLNRCNSFIRYRASLADNSLTEERRRKKESQKIDDLPVLATCRFVTLAILSSEVDGPDAHGST